MSRRNTPIFAFLCVLVLLITSCQKRRLEGKITAKEYEPPKTVLIYQPAIHMNTTHSIPPKYLLVVTDSSGEHRVPVSPENWGRAIVGDSVTINY